MENENQIFTLLGEIKGQISGFVRDVADVTKTKDDHELRLRSLEAKNNKQAGVIVGATAVATAAASVIAFAVNHLIGK